MGGDGSRAGRVIRQLALYEDVGESIEVQLGFPSHIRVLENSLLKGFVDSFVRKNCSVCNLRRTKFQGLLGIDHLGLSLTQSNLRTLPTVSAPKDQKPLP